MNGAPITDNLARTLDRISDAASRAGRDPADVTLIAVSKAQAVEKVAAAAAAGHLDFGENYVQEFRDKVARYPDLRWHYIGRIQTNKIKYLVGNVHCIHSVDRLKAARQIGRRSVAAGIVTDVLAQVNIGWETSKGGFEPDSAEDDIGALLEVDGVRLRGLMVVPPFLDAEDVRPFFVQLRNLRDHLQRALDHPLPHLSMGMSGDFEVAIEEGATHVRVGTAIFGARVR